MSVRAVPEIIRTADPPQWTPAELAAWEQFVGPSPDLLAALKAREIMAMRELARRNYRDFLKYWILVTRQRLKWAWFHDYLADLMQTVADRQRKRVIVNIPPRHLKSTLISQAWHAWMIGRDDTPNSALMSLAATGSLAARDSRRTLDILRADWYHVLFPHVTLTRENEVEWDTAGGAYRVAVGRGGTVTGKGGDHICVDDLLLSDEASSETIREKCNEWLGETLASRLNDPKTGTITIIMQRFHERDPAGYILERMKVEGADQYAHIVLPMEAEKRTLVCLDGEVYKDRLAGDLLDPGRIGPQEVAALKASMRINYEGQYQQNPCKQAGGMLDPSRLLELDQTAAELISRFGLRVNAYLDFATREAETQRDDPDFSTIVAAARDQLGRIFLLDVFRKQCATDELARTLIGMQKAYNFRMVKGEKGGLINTFMPILTMTQRMTGCFFALTPYKGPSSKGDKVHRASSFQGLLNAGMICVPKNAHWLPSMQAEMRSFPNGAHDDIIDSCAMACNDALDLMEGEAPIVKPDDERTLMDQEHKAELARRIEVMRRGDDDGYQTDHDW